LLRCDGATCTPLDMGTPFDFFDTAANTDSPQVTDAQRANRHRLRDAMARAGFRNYPMEWWHFTLQPEPTPHTQYDVPVR
jgi:zinc D-Ala-D-Ala dipeptidase